MVFVSYIRRYVLTKVEWGESRSDVDSVFVSYIRRYVLTKAEVIHQGDVFEMFSSPIFGDMFLLKTDEEKEIVNEICFRLLYSEICSYYI